jgi:hypothetical protein
MRWQVAVAIAVALLDLAVIWRWYSGPDMVVSRAALATARSGGCREVMFIRGGGLDRLYLVDVASGKRGPQVTIGQVAYAGGTLTTSSTAAVAAGQDLDTSGQNPTTPQPTLASGYASAAGSHDTWIGGPCMPLENPLAAQLQPAGSVRLSSGLDRVYAGTVRYSKGSFDLFAQARVRIGVTAGGRLAFEGLAGQPLGGGTAAATQVLLRFMPRATPLSGLTAAKRLQTYDAYYRQAVKDLPLLAPPLAGAPGV